MSNLLVPCAIDEHVQALRAVDVDIEPPLPTGFRRWGDGGPTLATWIKAVFATPDGYRVVRGNAGALCAQNPGWQPFAWQRSPFGRVLPPGWRAFPEALPPPDTHCCVMYFDLAGELEDCAGFGRYQGGWPFGQFSDRAACPGEPSPCDGKRWAPYAWRVAAADEIDVAAIAAAIGGPGESAKPLHVVAA